jgi:hypothetical protein
MYGVRQAGAWTGIYTLALLLAMEFESPALRSAESGY